MNTDLSHLFKKRHNPATGEGAGQVGEGRDNAQRVQSSVTALVNLKLRDVEAKDVIHPKHQNTPSF